MKKKLTTVDFHGTKEQEEKLLAVIEKHGKKSFLPLSKSTPAKREL